MGVSPAPLFAMTGGKPARCWACVSSAGQQRQPSPWPAPRRQGPPPPARQPSPSDSTSRITSPLSASTMRAMRPMARATGLTLRPREVRPTLRPTSRGIITQHSPRVSRRLAKPRIDVSNFQRPRFIPVCNLFECACPVNVLNPHTSHRTKSIMGQGIEWTNLVPPPRGIRGGVY